MFKSCSDQQLVELFQYGPMLSFSLAMFVNKPTGLSPHELAVVVFNLVIFNLNYLFRIFNK